MLLFSSTNLEESEETSWSLVRLSFLPSLSRFPRFELTLSSIASPSRNASLWPHLCWNRWVGIELHWRWRRNLGEGAFSFSFASRSLVDDVVIFHLTSLSQGMVDYRTLPKSGAQIGEDLARGAGWSYDASVYFSVLFLLRRLFASLISPPFVLSDPNESSPPSTHPT